jgi:hypothetical protein
MLGRQPLPGLLDGVDDLLSGLLMGGQQGRAGGYLSDKAIQLLNPENTDDPS